MLKTKSSKFWSRFLRGACLAGCLLMLVGSVPAETPSELLEKAKYKEETAGDVDAAIGLYREIIKTATDNRHAVAEAHLRLGQCLIKQGKKDEGQKILKTLQGQYPEEKELVAVARKMTQEKLVLLPTPWANKEVSQFSVKFPMGDQIGSLTLEAKLRENNGKECWELLQEFSVLTFRQVSKVVADKDTFAPITVITSNTLMGRCRAEYTPEKLSLTTEKSTSTQTTKDIALSGITYDNEQLYFLVRRLPLAEGYKASLPIFCALGEIQTEYLIEVVGKEKKKTSAGEFECFKVQVDMWTGKTRTLQHFIYCTTDAKHQVVYYDAVAFYMELVKNYNFKEHGDIVAPL